MNKIIRYGLMASNVIFSSAIFIVGGVLLGIYLDYSFGTKMVFTLIFSLIGLGIGIWVMIVTILKIVNSR